MITFSKVYFQKYVPWGYYYMTVLFNKGPAFVVFGHLSF